MYLRNIAALLISLLETQDVLFMTRSKTAGVLAREMVHLEQTSDKGKGKMVVQTSKLVSKTDIFKRKKEAEVQVETMTIVQVGT